MIVGVFSLACSDTEPEDTTNADCNGGKCDGNEGWIEANLQGRDDVIAEFLKTKSGVDEDGFFQTNLLKIQRELAAVSDCDPGDSRNYVISDQLIVGAGEEDFPRVVSTICTNDADKRWRTFLSPPSITSDGDIDVQTIEMFSWDETRKGFNFYKTSSAGGEDVHIEVEPTECADCHLGGRGLSAEHMPMLPIMNELTQPWEHWNASPGFDSQHHFISDEVRAKPNYAEVAGESWSASASELESTIRKAQKVVADQRVLLRRKKGEASVSEGMSILRPIFCDEQINYVSESGESGQLLMNSVVDVSMRDIFAKLDVSGDAGKKWRDINARVRLPQDRGGEDKVSMLPVRGDSNIIYELALISAARGLEPKLAAQVRLLDWKTPVFSSLRCGLWTQTNERLKKEKLDVDLSSIRNYALIPILMEEILTVGEASLLLEDRFYILNDGEKLEELATAIVEGSVPDATCDEQGKCVCDDLPFCIGTVNDASYVIENNLASVFESETIREDFAAERKERVCIAKACYNNAPFIEDSEHCSQSCPLDDTFAGR